MQFQKELRFPNEPIVTVRAKVMEAQFIETMLLLSINHQSLIATKANRVVTAANGRVVMDLSKKRSRCRCSHIRCQSSYNQALMQQQLL